MKVDGLLAHYEQIADAPEAIPRLRRFILDLAIRGKLVDQDSNDEPASELLKQIAAEKARLVRLKIIKARRASAPEFHSVLPFDLPVGWTLVRVEEVLVELQTGPFGSSLHQSDYQLGGVPVVNPASIQNERIVPVSKMAVGPTTLARLASFKLQTGDVILARRGEMGRCAVVTERESGWLCGTGSLILRSFKCIYPRFLSMLIGSPFSRQYLSGTAVGTTMQNLNQTILLNLPLGLPPLAEQHRIVAKVNELMALCDQLEVARTERETTRNRLATASLSRLNAPDPDPTTFQNHAAFALENITPLTTRPDQIRALRQTVLNLAVRGKLVEQDTRDAPAAETLKKIGIERADLVQRKFIRHKNPLDRIDADEPPFEIPHQWCWIRIGEVALFAQYGTSTKSMSSEQGIPVLTMGNIQDGEVVFWNEKKIPRESAELPMLFLRKFDLLYNRTNSAELVGKTGIYLGEDNCRTFASYLIRIRLSLTFSSPRYVNLAMNAPIFRETQIVPLIKKQTGQANVNGTALKHMLLPFPPLAEQHRIVAKVDELMALCDRLEESLATGDYARRRLLETVLHDALAANAEKKTAEGRLGYPPQHCLVRRH